MQNPTPPVDPTLPHIDATALREQVQQLQDALSEAREAVQQLERRQRINELLAQADTRDLGAARLLTEAALEAMPTPDIEAAISELREHKPWLFRRPAMTTPAAGAMPARFTEADDALADAAAQAQASGDRRSLMNYLRLRRGAKGGA